MQSNVHWRTIFTIAREFPLDGITDSGDMSLSKPWKLVMDKEAWHAPIPGVTKNQTWLRDQTELNWMYYGDMWKLINLKGISQKIFILCLDVELNILVDVGYMPKHAIS